MLCCVVQFGDGSNSDCVVGDWSDWSSCKLSTIGTSANSTQMILKSRSRSVLSGSIGCPPLQQVMECSKYHVLTQWDVVVFSANRVLPVRDCA